MIYLCRKRTPKQDSLADTESGLFHYKQRIEGETVTEDLLIKFQDGEDLTEHDILEAPGEVIGKSSYGTLYMAIQRRRRSWCL